MNDPSRAKYESDNEITDKDIVVREPLKVEEENRRRFVRLQISSPMSMRKIKDIFGNYWPDGGDYTIAGSILNISACGVLVELDQPLNEGDVVAMRFALEKVEPLDGILGIVKRCDVDDEAALAGIEFVERKDLNDRLSNAEMDLLSQKLMNFKASVRDVLGRYIHESGN